MTVAFRILAWALSGAAFMVAMIAPVGLILWVPAFLLAVAGILLGARSGRFVFTFVTGIGLALIVFGLVNLTYITITFFGLLVALGGATGFAAFGPRTSRAEPPAPAQQADPSAETPDGPSGNDPSA